MTYRVKFDGIYAHGTILAPEHIYKGLVKRLFDGISYKSSGSDESICDAASQTRKEMVLFNKNNKDGGKQEEKPGTEMKCQEIPHGGLRIQVST